MLQLGNDFGCFFAWHTPISSVCPPPGPIDLLAMAHRALCGLNIFSDATTAIEAFKADVVVSFTDLAFRLPSITIS